MSAGVVSTVLAAANEFVATQPLGATLVVGFALTALYVLHRRTIWVALGLLGLVPISLIPVWMVYSSHWWFAWVKTFSVCLGVWIQALLRKVPASRNIRALWLFKWTVLPMNITEAVIVDATKGEYVNAAAGVLLILAVGLPRSHSIEKGDPQCSTSYETTWAWILSYTVWNWTFTAHYTPASHLSGFVLNLLPALIAFCSKKTRWLEARAITLAGFCIYVLFNLESGFARASWPEYVEALGAGSTFWGAVACALGVVALVQNVMCVLQPKPQKKEL
eukprot:m51a1_g3165 hypothetical protein (277) ;mRNA; f:379776-380879